jgi:hypothetical protein
MQMLCRRDTPRNAFVFPQIREMRGTGSALTADADEFGTARALRPGQARAQEKRRNVAGVWKIIGTCRRK